MLVVVKLLRLGRNEGGGLIGMHGRSRMLASLQCGDRARRVFTDQANIA